MSVGLDQRMMKGSLLDKFNGGKLILTLHFGKFLTIEVVKKRIYYHALNIANFLIVWVI